MRNYELIIYHCLGKTYVSSHPDTRDVGSAECDDPGNCQWTATWIRVHKDGVKLADGGDSGGPWLSKYTAYGVRSGSLYNDAIYMAINYVDVLNITVLME